MITSASTPPRNPQHFYLAVLLPIALWAAQLIVMSLAVSSTAGAADNQYLFKREPARYALVIGNTTYDYQQQLPSAAEDVRRITEKLEALKFKVTKEESFPSVRQLEDDVLPKFRSQIHPGDIVVIYFSGHGFAYGQNNFIAPANLPKAVSYQDVTKYAIAVENLEDYFERDSPGLVLVLIDACRTIAGFVVFDESNRNLVQKGTMEALNANNANSALFAFASESGKPALATSSTGVPSLFTNSLDTRLATPGAEFLTLFKDVRADVAVATHDAQQPQVTVWSSSDLYLAPSSDVLSKERDSWLAALESHRADAVQAFLHRYSTSQYAAAARKWIADNAPNQSNYVAYAAVSPVAIDRLWASNNVSGRVIATNKFEGFGYSRFLDSGTTQKVEALDDHSLGLVAQGAAALPFNSTSYNLYLDSVATHRSVIATKDVVARVAPSATADVGAHFPLGMLVTIDGIKRGAAGNAWFAASVPGNDSVFYVPAVFNTSAKTFSPGKSLLEIQAPPQSEHFPDLIDAKTITDSLATLKAQGHSISWVSLSTGSVESVGFDAERLALVRAGELAHAEYVLKHSGIDGKHITSLAGVNDLQRDGVRVRFFGN
jgi:hypothetical protein